MTLTELFIILCSIDSESGHEAELSRYIQTFLDDRGFSYRLEKDLQIVVSVPAKNKDSFSTLLFCAHMDTVSPGKGVVPIVDENGKISSQGETILGADNKASLANILFLLDKISKGEILEHHALECVFTVREEVDDPGVYDMDLDILRADVGFVFDKANETQFNTVVSVASSISDFVVKLEGKGAHAGTPERGINALEMMVNFVSHLSLGRPYPNSTFNIGLINGGDATNTVPARMEMAGDFRSEEVEYMKKMEEDLYTAREVTLKDPKFIHAEIDIQIVVYCRGYKHNVESHSYTRLSHIYHELGHGKLIPLSVQMGSDASCFMNHTTNAIETFCLNDGCFNVHSLDEWTSVENLEKIAGVMEELVKNW